MPHLEDRLWRGALFNLIRQGRAARRGKEGRTGAALIALAGMLLVPSPTLAATRTYIVTDFDSVRLEAPIAVAVQNRRGVSARGEGDRELLERVDLIVSGRVLTIRLKPSPFGGRSAPSGGVRLFLTAPSLRRLELAGAGTLAADGLDALRGDLRSAGSGILSIRNISSDTLSVAQMGSGTIDLAGKAGKVVMRLSGSGILDATKLDAADLDLTAEGASIARARASRAARIVAIGPGLVSVEGRAACTVRHAGSGTVTCSGENF